jgi:hypothetical protein
VSMIRKSIVSMAALAVLAMMIPVAGKAETPGRHPRYLHARTDLRVTQMLSRVHEEPNVMRNLRRCDEEIEAAIHEIDVASVIDHKDLEDHPRIDTHLDRNGRFRKMMELLDSARRDIGAEEDNPRAIGWRNAAFRHIDEARNSLKRAAVDLRIDRELGY